MLRAADACKDCVGSARPTLSVSRALDVRAQHSQTINICHSPVLSTSIELGEKIKLCSGVCGSRGSCLNYARRDFVYDLPFGLGDVESIRNQWVAGIVILGDLLDPFSKVLEKERVPRALI